MATSRPERAPTYSESLRQRDDAALVALLGRRPDLATPSPSTLLSLAARAMNRTSLERALAGLDELTLHVLEAVLVLDSVGSSATATAVARATGVDRARVTAALALLDELALVWTPGTRSAGFRPAPGVAEVLGPHPAGLGPVAAPAAGEPSATGTSARPTAPPGDLPDDAPPGARAILDALTWGPPVGVAPRADASARRATGWLVEHGYLRTTDERHVVLPREVGLALRGGRTHRDVRTAPPVPDVRELPAATVDAESASAGLEAVRLVARLVTHWTEHPPGVLRGGGLGVRDLRRAGLALEVDDPTAAAVVELAAAAGLVADDGDDPPTFAPTLGAEDWLEDGLGDRWATLARGWWRSRRTPWLVGSRDEKGALRAALDPELWRPWVPRLRRSVLDVLDLTPGRPLAAADVVAVLRWRTPRAVPPEQAVAGLLREAALLGVTGAGALAPPGRALVASDDAPSGTGAADLGAAFEAVLPAEVDDLLLQGDLTGIVPGRPSRTLERLVEVAADVESRGAATTVRFTPESVLRALDRGATADELLAELASHSRTPVPQPLEYLVRDTARRHGRVRVGTASSYVRAEDPVLLAGIAEDPALRGLGLVLLAPTVLASAAPAGELQEALRARGVPAVVEGPDGRVLVADRAGRRGGADDVAAPRRGRLTTPGRRAGGRARTGVVPGSGARVDEPGGAESRSAQRFADLVARLRAADSRSAAQTDGRAGGRRTEPGPAGGDGPRTGGPAPSGTNGHGGDHPVEGTSDPVAALGLLREAIADGAMVWLEVVGPTGSQDRRRVRPLTLDAGRLRAQDPARDAELTVAVHRIASVAPDTPPAEDPGGAR
ncbi:helicase-associated domain-containing protein [Cellulosimicrobium cellulans]|uniref:helicase-associated domain-containing protein n=1 Tax=Cellulosimicrobium cellulans TaxID=1710 RepID=UPI001964885E|nr:helicase-associated domain-containing protein [Cellulosimicrobium cellulans]MBN0041869.1 helicase-associated domain-containing protein [Cellulosimicrobium cellulans]